MNYRFLFAALLDVQDYAVWYNGRQPGLGDRFADRVEEFAVALTANPRMCRRVSRPPAGREIREGYLGRFPFLVHYEVTATEVVILSVVHARSRFRPWRQRLRP
jgi:plasmid stabilization system protein ParE